MLVKTMRNRSVISQVKTAPVAVTVAEAVEFVLSWDCHTFLDLSTDSPSA